MSTIKAFAVLEHHTCGLIDVPKPVCGPLDAICRPIVLTPCNTDVHKVLSEIKPMPVGHRLGHECVGQIVEIGCLVTDFKVGDTVVVSANKPTWGDKMSQEGFPMHSTGTIGNSNKKVEIHGSFAELFMVNEADNNLAMLPEGMDPAIAVMATDMMSTGFHGAELADIKFGDSVCILGLGPVGLMAVSAAALGGAGRIIAVDGWRRICNKLAMEYGATDIIDFREGPVDAQVMKLTNGFGVHKVIIAGGDSNILETAIKMVRYGGIVVNLNYITDSLKIPIPTLEWGFGLGHKDIRGGKCPGGRSRMERMLELIKYKRCDPSGLITHRFEGFDKIDEAFRLLILKTEDVIKPVVFIKYD